MLNQRKKRRDKNGTEEERSSFIIIHFGIYASTLAKRSHEDMYAAADDKTVYLGVPTKGKIIARETDLLKISHIGGQVMWHDPSKAPSSVDVIACRVCNSSESVALVAKVFAPVEEDRSLYVFCCNKRTCSLQAGAWVVIRNQITANINQELAAPSKEESQVTATAPPKGTMPAASIPSGKESIWNFQSATDAGNDDEDDLLALLASRDLSLSQPSGKGKSKKNGASAKSELPPKTQDKKFLGFQTTVMFPLVTLAEHEEEWDEEYYTMSLGVDVHQEHIDRLLASYLRDEDDAENLSALHHAGLSGVREGVVSSSGAPSTPYADATAASSALQGEEDNDNNEDEKDIQTASEAEEYFQRRVQVCPKQVLRYAYEGSPLWISSPSPLDSHASAVPVCELCGSARVFECQLMPALLTHLSSKKEKAGNEDKKSPPGAALEAHSDIKHRLKSILGTGLDFGVVTIWSCPQSCSPPSGGFATEAVLIQPPPDTLSLDL